MSKNSGKRVGVFVQLPAATLQQIKKLKAKGRPQWQVVVDGINALSPKKSAGK